MLMQTGPQYLHLMEPEPENILGIVVAVLCAIGVAAYLVYVMNQLDK